MTGRDDPLGAAAQHSRGGAFIAVKGVHRPANAPPQVSGLQAFRPRFRLELGKPREETYMSLASTIGRRWLIVTGAVLGAVLFALPAATPARAAEAPVKIGIIGTGRIGGALARHWVAKGHEVFVSSRHPEELQSLVKELGPRAHAGTPREAAAFGSVVVVSIPYAAMPQIGEELSKELAGKVILDTSNPVERRDGAMALDAQKKGAGVATAELLHNKRVVRAFNCVPAATLANDGDHKPQRYAIPIGGDDPTAIKIAERLVKETGFDPVLVGSLAQTRQFDLGQPLAKGNLTAAEMHKQLGH
jgi:predicted dinucleotide-binding enzyme